MAKFLILCPAVDGSNGAHSIFDSLERDTGQSATPVRSVTLESHQLLGGGAIWLRYKLQNG
jgi:hypothetical protein